jgi:hypothetical protein
LSTSAFSFFLVCAKVVFKVCVTSKTSLLFSRLERVSALANNTVMAKNTSWGGMIEICAVA